MPVFSKYLIIAGFILAFSGLIYWLVPGVFNWFGKLPGDIRISKNGYSVYIPIVSMLLISVVLTIVLNLLGKYLK